MLNVLLGYALQYSCWFWVYQAKVFIKVFLKNIWLVNVILSLLCKKLREGNNIQKYNLIDLRKFQLTSNRILIIYSLLFISLKIWESFCNRLKLPPEFQGYHQIVASFKMQLHFYSYSHYSFLGEAHPLHIYTLIMQGTWTIVLLMLR